METKLVRATSRFARCLVLGLAVAAVVPTAGCGSKAPAVTGLTVTVTMVGVAADQLELTVTTGDGEALAPTRRPLAAGGVLASPQSVSIFLPDALADQPATCTVTPYLADQIAGSAGSGTATLALHALVPVAIELRATPHDDDGGADGDATDDGGPIDDAPVVDGASDAGDDGAVAKANGQVCGSDGECDSTLCVDGVCCASACGGLCQACNLAGKEGTCAPVPAGAASKLCANQGAPSCGFDGTCDGNGGCRRYPAGVGCKAAACSASTYTPASACDGQGTCAPSSNVDCTPYLCDATAAACGSKCTTQADCVSGRTCTNGSCGTRAKQDNGIGCVAAADCVSGHCSDGVCCAAACTGACTSCNQPGLAGMCLPVGVGKPDPHALCKDAGATTCGRNGLCDGAGACALYGTTTMCAAGSCKNATLHPPHHCDGKGACVTPADVDCAPYRCDAATTACYTSCTVGALQCAARHACAANVCQ